MEAGPEFLKRPSQNVHFALLELLGRFSRQGIKMLLKEGIILDALVESCIFLNVDPPFFFVTSDNRKIVEIFIIHKASGFATLALEDGICCATRAQHNNKYVVSRF